MGTTVSSGNSGAQVKKKTTQAKPQAEAKKAETTSKPAEATATSKSNKTQQASGSTQTSQANTTKKQPAAQQKNQKTSETFKALDQAVTKDVGASQQANKKGGIGDQLNKTKEKVGGFFNKAKKNTEKAVDSVVDSAGDKFNEVKEDVTSSEAWQTSGKAANAVGNFAKGVVDDIGYAAKGYQESYKEIGEQYKDNMGDIPKDAFVGMQHMLTQREEMREAKREDYANWRPEKLETVEDMDKAIDFYEQRYEDKARNNFGKFSGLFTAGDDEMKHNLDAMHQAREFAGKDGNTELSTIDKDYMNQLIDQQNESYGNYIDCKKTSAEVVGNSAAIVAGIGATKVMAPIIAGGGTVTAGVQAFTALTVGGGTGAAVKLATKEAALADDSGVDEHVVLSKEGAYSAGTGYVAGAGEAMVDQFAGALAPTVGKFVTNRTAGALGTNAATTLGKIATAGTTPVLAGTNDAVAYNAGHYLAEGELASAQETAVIFGIGSTLQGVNDAAVSGGNTLSKALVGDDTTRLARRAANEINSIDITSLNGVDQIKSNKDIFNIGNASSNPYTGSQNLVNGTRLFDVDKLSSQTTSSLTSEFSRAFNTLGDSSMSLATNRPISKSINRNTAKALLADNAVNMAESAGKHLEKEVTSGPVNAMNFGNRVAQESGKANQQNEGTAGIKKNLWNLFGLLTPPANASEGAAKASS